MYSLYRGMVQPALVGLRVGRLPSGFRACQAAQRRALGCKSWFGGGCGWGHARVAAPAGGGTGSISHTRACNEEKTLF